MIIYFFIFTLILSFYAINNYENYLKNLELICLFLLLSIFAGMRALDVSRDGINYAYMFDRVYQYSDWFTSANELMAVIIPVTLKYLGVYSYFSIFIIFAILGVGFKLLAIKKYSPLPLLSVLFYYSNFFILHEMTQIRAGVATGILLLTISDIYEKNLFKFLLKVAFACTFHISSLAFLPVYFINPKKLNRNLYLTILLIVIPLGILKSINIFKLIPNLSSFSAKLMVYEALQNGMTEVNLFNTTTIIYILILLLQLMFIDQIIGTSKYAIILMKLTFFGVISLFAFSAIPIIAWRINELFITASFISITYLYYFIRPRVISNIFIILISFLIFSLNILRQGLLQPYHTLFS